MKTTLTVLANRFILESAIADEDDRINNKAKPKRRRSQIAFMADQAATETVPNSKPRSPKNNDLRLNYDFSKILDHPVRQKSSESLVPPSRDNSNDFNPENYDVKLDIEDYDRKVEVKRQAFRDGVRPTSTRILRANSVAEFFSSLASNNSRTPGSFIHRKATRGKTRVGHSFARPQSASAANMPINRSWREAADSFLEHQVCMVACD
jgi:hypothetical protein